MCTAWYDCIYACVGQGALAVRLTPLCGDTKAKDLPSRASSPAHTGLAGDATCPASLELTPVGLRVLSLSSSLSHSGCGQHPEPRSPTPLPLTPEVGGWFEPPGWCANPYQDPWPTDVGTRGPVPEHDPS